MANHIILLKKKSCGKEETYYFTSLDIKSKDVEDLCTLCQEDNFILFDKHFSILQIKGEQLKIDSYGDLLTISVNNDSSLEQRIVIVDKKGKKFRLNIPSSDKERMLSDLAI